MHAGPAPNGSRPATWRLLLFDGARLERDGRQVVVPTTGMRLLAYLALQGSVTRAKAAGSLWPGSSEDHAHASLRTAVWRLRSLCDRVEVQQDRLGLADDVWVDVRCLRALALRTSDGSDGDPGADLDAVRCGRGELLAGWYDDWVLSERERLRQLRLHVLERVVVLLLRRQDYGRALEVALDVVEVEPLREGGHCAVISVHLAEGNYVEALREYHAFERLLADELGIEPSARMQSLLARHGAIPSARRPRRADAVTQA